MTVSALLGNENAFCQTSAAETAKTKDEQEAKSLDLRELHKFLLPYKFSPRVGLYSGYDSNVNLDHARKGDVFEEFALSMSFSKPWLENIKWSEGIKFTFDYDLDVLNYNEFTDASNILNHFNLGLHKRYKAFSVGTGYDLGILYYPHNEDGNFLMHKGFVYLRQNIFRNVYHQVRFEEGFKHYTDKDALGESLNVLQDKKRHDDRYTIDYSIGSNITPRLFARLNGKYSVNTSNAIYQDFYDYKSYEAGAYLDYQLIRSLRLFSRATVMHKDYSRTVTLRDYKERVNYYSATIGATYQLNKNNSLTAYYTRRNSYSNDHLETYFENVFTGGWQYRF